MANANLNLRELIQNDWKNILNSCFDQEWMGQLERQLADEYESQQVFPPISDVFRALQLTSFEDVKVVILGQDPYHGIGEAQGFSFSVPNGIKTPPSLRNIFKELAADLGGQRTQTDLTDWANQGVLLLNTVLTVRANQPGSHAKFGWQKFTSIIINSLNQRDKPIVFMLWGNYAQQAGKQIDETKHLVIRCSHPSPLSANRGGWFGTKPFSRANDFLGSPIQWT
ncbi:MAG: Uracil-DNA glycosylase [Bacteroidota bacterium]